mgnify:FL=1
MNKKFIGRKSEIYNLSQIMNRMNDNQSTSGSLIAIDGRRRCGKTTLIEHFIQKQMNSIENDHLTFVYFKFIGNLSLSYKENIVACINELEYQLQKLPENIQLILMGKNIKFQKSNASWATFFQYLDLVLSTLKEMKNIRFFIFFDEVSWYDKKNKFIKYFANMWNIYFVHYPNLMCFLASSLSTWMREKIINNTDMLYGRLTLKIELHPFTLEEIYQYAKSLYPSSSLNIGAIIHYYMIFGGIIKYYDMIDFSKSFEQNIERIIFDKDIRNNIISEYDLLFNGLMNNSGLYDNKRASYHKEIMLVLSKIKSGNFNDIYQAILKKYKNNANIHENYIYQDLNDLLNSRLISIQDKDGKELNLLKKESKRNKIYTINDLFCFFNLYFQEKYLDDINKSSLLDIFEDSYWRGTAFEILIICNKHILEKALNISQSNVANQFTLNLIIKDEQSGKQKAQIDILIQTSDKSFIGKSLHLIELKNYSMQTRLKANEIDTIYNKADYLLDMLYQQQKKDNVNNIQLDILLLSLYPLNKIVNEDLAGYKIQQFNLFDYLSEL